MYQRWPRRDPVKNYFMVPNEVFGLGLNSNEISIYNYLLRCEDRKTYQCHPSYRTIGNAVNLCENTVRKYVSSLEEKGLIRTDPSRITTWDGRVRNGSLIYTIRPVQEAVELYHQRQLKVIEEETERARVKKRLEQLEQDKGVPPQPASLQPQLPAVRAVSGGRK